MVEHRRVEPRTVIAGTGMASDPERVRTIEDEAARRQRGWHGPPAKGFDEVLDDTPAKAQELEELQQDGPTRPTRAKGEGDDVKPRLPPDPRAQALHAQLAARLKQAPVTSTLPTKPRGA